MIPVLYFFGLSGFEGSECHFFICGITDWFIKNMLEDSIISLHDDNGI